MLSLAITNLARIINTQQHLIPDTETPLLDVTADSRHVLPSNVFFSLQGPNFDGHQFLQQALNQGVVCAVVEQVDPEINIPQLQVNSTLDALAKSAKWWHQQCSATVIAACGSHGKSTVKNMLVSLLQSLYLSDKILDTQENLNNHIDVPLTLLRLNPQHQISVVEMGTNHLGEIAVVAELTKPDIAIITNAGLDHLQGFGNVLGSAQTNAEVFAGMTDGIAILNAEDDYFPYWCKQACHLDID